MFFVMMAIPRTTPKIDPTDALLGVLIRTYRICASWVPLNGYIESATGLGGKRAEFHYGMKYIPHGCWYPAKKPASI